MVARRCGIQDKLEPGGSGGAGGLWVGASGLV